MNQEDILSGRAGLSGIQSLIHGHSSRRLLRSEAQRMLQPEYRAGPFHLTRVKFKPDRKLLAYFTFPALNHVGETSRLVHLAVSWLKTLDGNDHRDGWAHLQEEANRSGLMPVQCDLWRDLPDRGMRLQIWPFDPEFPHLARLGNPSYVARRLASLGIAQELKELPVVTPIRYRPGERHVLRYDIDSAHTDQAPRQRLYAKLYSNVQDAAKAFGIANRVVDWLADNNLGLQGVRPEAVDNEEGVIFYPHAPGIPLSHQLHRSRRWLAAQLQIIGRALATMHNGPETLQADLRQNTLANEVRVVKRASEHIQILLPDTYHNIIEILDKIQDRYMALPQEPPTFTHSDFKSDHLLTTPQGLTLIDFDTCTLTDPALDVGKFLADLEWWFTRRGLSGVADAQEELLNGYLGEGEPEQNIYERLARAKLFHALILVKIIVRRVPLYKKQWADHTRRMISKAAMLLHKAK